MKGTNPVIAFAALGSNIGDRAGQMDRAIEALKNSQGVEVLAVSQFLETAAVGGPLDSPPYLNAAAKLRTTLDPATLLKLFLDIERKMGRVRRTRWEPRPIDLDLLLYGDRIIRDDDLKLPHPLMHERRFVLTPLAEIAPQVIHPVTGKTVSQMLSALGSRV